MWDGRVTLDVQIGLGTRGGALGQWDVARWDRAQWSGLEPDWVSVRCDVASLSIDTGRTSMFDPFRAGTLELLVDNDDGFWSWRPDVIPHQLPMRPARPIRVVADDLVTGSSSVLWTGFVERTEDTYQAGSGVSARVTAIDGFSQWALVAAPPFTDPQLAGQTVTDRLIWLSALVAWPLEWALFDPSDVTLVGTRLTGTGLDEAQRAVDAEGGALYVDPAGILRFRHRDWLRADPDATTVHFELVTDHAQATVAPPVCPTGYAVVGPDLATVINVAQFGRDGQTAVVTVVDQHSIDTYQRRTFQSLSNMADQDAQLALLARRRVAWQSQPAPMIQAAVIDPETDPAGWPLVLGARFGWRLLVHYQHPTAGWGWTIPAQIQAVRHEIDAPPGRWTTTFGLIDATRNTAGPVWDANAGWDHAHWTVRT